jgi:hypothetical protein
MHLSKKLKYEFKKFGIYILIIFILLVIIILFDINIISVITTVFLIILASFSKLYKQFTGKLSLGFELITPITVIFAYTYGLMFAWSVSIVTLLVSSFIAGKIDFPSTVIEAFTYLILCILTIILSSMPFKELALFMMVMRDVIMVPPGIILLGRNFIHMIIIVATNLLFNFLFIIWFGEFIVNLL